MAQTLGLVQFTWNGQTYKTKVGSKVKLGGLKQMPIDTGQQTDYAAEYEHSEITAETVLQAGQSLKAIFTAGQGELQCKCDTGQLYTWSDAFITNLAEFTSGKGGNVPIHWAGGVPTETLS